MALRRDSEYFGKYIVKDGAHREEEEDEQTAIL